MATGAMNALAMYANQQRNQSVLNQVANPQVVNPGGALQNAIQTAAMLKYLKNGMLQPQAMRVGMVGNTSQPVSSGVNALNTLATTPPTSAAPAAPATTAATTRPATTPATTSSPGWFMPQSSATRQGNSVYVGPNGQRYLDTSPPTLPYSQWQQSGNSNTGNAVANPVSGPTAAYSDLANAIMRDPSDANLKTAFGALSDSGFGAYADLWRSHVASMTPDQRRVWAQSFMQSSAPSYTPTVSIPSNASDLVRNALTDFSQQTGSGLSVQP